MQKAKMTYRVVEKPDEICSRRSCAKHMDCGFDHIPKSRIYLSLKDGKHYAMVSDGAECWAMVEVEPEGQCEK